jgi:putative spermidine/putrescine transport system substrate-binding protein
LFRSAQAEQGPGKCPLLVRLAQEADYFGETPANTLACPIMDTIQKGSCAAYHANAPESYFQTIKFWKTPLAQCDDGKSDCVPFQDWVSVWTQITG